MTTFPALDRRALEVLQVNLGYRCNLRCAHCHVDAGPHRREMMDDATLAMIVPVMQARGITTLDLTGGAPELHPGFRALVAEARAAGLRVLDRCNLSVLMEPSCYGLSAFMAEHEVEIIASLPCYLADNVDRQRGDGAFAASIAALRQLNDLGYGQPGGSLALHLVFNPQGPDQPPEQRALEEAYRETLGRDYGIVFTDLFTLANMPIGRFAARLHAQGSLEDYRRLLRAAMQPDNLDQVMCRSLLSVDWQGRLFDCDFNQQVALPPVAGGPRHLRELLEIDPCGQAITVAEHCYGCTAGQGSSCGGALS